MSKWERVKLGDVLEYEQPTKYIVQTTDYKNDYRTPVLTAGQSFLLGYTDETENVFSNLPVIIFDDFTTSNQFVDFPFKVKSSAMKILKATKKGNLKYLYYYMKTIKVDTQLHKRYWISTYANLEILLPPPEIQQKIADVLDCASELIEKRKAQKEQLDILVKSRFIEMFGDPVINSKKLSLQLLGELSNLKPGKNVKASNIRDRSDLYQYPCYGGNGLRGYVKSYSHEGNYPLIGRQGALCGNIQLAEGKFYPTEHAIVVTPIIEYDTIWMLYSLSFLDLNRFQTGAAQPGLNIGILKKIKVPFPPLYLQKKFSYFVRNIEKQKFLLEQSLSLLEQNYESLLQRSFKGEIFNE